MVLEGTYPYVAGGVSTWTHDIIRGLPQYQFHVLCLMPPGADRTMRYELPDNVCGVTAVTLQQLEPKAARVKGQKQLLENLRTPLDSIIAGGGIVALQEIMALLEPQREQLGQQVLLDSPEAWKLLVNMYQATYGDTSFLDYFWSWRALMGGLFSLLLAPLPKARMYHTVSTGYAGLYAARARVESKRPALVTEHGIYTNERRIEIATADWLFEIPLIGLGIDKPTLDLKNFWTGAFEGYSLACYQACNEIITLYEGNQTFQLADGASAEKLKIIPNGIDFPRFSKIIRSSEERRPTIALIGRVVPIKDVKTYIRAVSALRTMVPDVRALMMGPTEEDEEYYGDCVAMVENLGLQNNFEFTGRVLLDDWLGQVDVVVLTSISEAQPLVLLEAGASGIPSVTTDVGSCSDIIYGRADEHPTLGPAGAIVRLADADAAANAIAKLLIDKDWGASCGVAIRTRVEHYYQERDVMTAYGAVYETYCNAADGLPTDWNKAGV
jgi:polysaccharide biosynthesis protein PelF